MRKILSRIGSAGAAVTLAVGVVGAAVLTAPAASAATGPLQVTVAQSGATSGDNNAVLGFTTPQNCDAQATRHVTKVVAATATNPADQSGMSGWVGRNFYSPVGVGLPGPFAPYPASANIQSWANTYGLQIYPGTWTFEFRCQNNLGTTIYDTFTGQISWSSPTAWTAVQATVATTTTLAASPTSAQVGAPVGLTATVAAASGTAAGSVEFKNGSTSLGSAPVDGSGVATLSTTSLPVGSNAVTAVFTGSGFASSTSSPVTVTVTAAPASDTTTTLAVTPASGVEYQSVTLTGTVSPASAAGTCTFKDGTQTLGSAPVNGGSCAISLSGFAAGSHSLTASFAPTNTQAFNASTSAPVTATYTAGATAPDPQVVTVTVPRGALTISTPYDSTSPLDLGTLALRADGTCYDASALFDKVTVTDTRAGQLGWSAFLTRAAFSNGGTGSIAADRESFTNVTAVPVAGNALQSIAVTDVPAGGGSAATSPAKFASAPANASVGSIGVTARFGLECVPTSVAPGTYTATVVFTVL